MLAVSLVDVICFGSGDRDGLKNLDNYLLKNSQEALYPTPLKQFTVMNETNFSVGEEEREAANDGEDPAEEEGGIRSFLHIFNQRCSSSV